MFDIICMIPVVLAGALSTKAVNGTLRAEGEQNYVVDFSVEAKRLGYLGEYDTVIIDKDKCVKFRKEKK